MSQTLNRYREFLVDYAQKMPPGPHFAVVVFGISTTSYFAFCDQEVGEKMLREYVEEKVREGSSRDKDFQAVFFQCPGVALPTINIEVVLPEFPKVMVR